MLDVETPVTGRVINTGALQVGGNKLTGSGCFFFQPLEAFNRFAVP
jgi:hypothetical protein